MPLPVAHGLLGASIATALHPRPQRQYFAPLLIGALLANAADFDFLLVFLFHNKAWHRSISHSILFAVVIWLLLLLVCGRKRIKEAIVYGLAYASHGILDYGTTKIGGGVELFWPFSSERLALGWVGLSEVPSKLAALEVVQALVIELILFAPLLILLLFVKRWAMQKGKYAAARGGSLTGASSGPAPECFLSQGFVGPLMLDVMP